MDYVWATTSGPGPKLEAWLRDAVAVKIKETILENKPGPAAEDKMQGERNTSVHLAPSDGI